MTVQTPKPKPKPKPKPFAFVRPLVIAAVYLAVMHQLLVGLRMGPAVHAGTPAVFLDASATAPVVATAAYLLMIFWGKRAMESREPVEVSADMICYNGYQVLLN